MRILITGGAGFLGSHLAKKIRDKGDRPYVVRHRKFDLTDKTQTLELFRTERPKLVYHLAAEVGGIGANQATPGRFWYSNLMMGMNVLEACRMYQTEKLVMVGTTCSYPKYTDVPFVEESLWDGYPEETNAPYGIAKKSLLTGCQAYRDQYGLNAIYLIPTNLYGPNDNFDLVTGHVIPALIKKMLTKEDIVLWGDGTPTRDFLYVEDCADALVLAAEKYNDPAPVNLGSGKEVSIKQTADLIADLTGYSGNVTWDDAKPNGQPRRALDNSRAKKLLGWKAKTPLRKGLKETIDWYQNSETVR